MKRRRDDLQHLYAQLVEECRLGWVYRGYYLGGEVRYTQHRPPVALAGVPVFSLGPINYDGIDVTVTRVDQALESGLFKLPFPRCVWLQSLDLEVDLDDPANAEALRRYPRLRETQNQLQYYALVTEEMPGGSILFEGFTSYPTFDHWVRHVWQITVHAMRDEVTIATDPDAHIPQEIVRQLRGETEARVFSTMGRILDIITAPSGRVSYLGKDGETQKIDARRTKMGLEPVPAVRVIHLADRLRASSTGRSGVDGWHPRRHLVRGHYRSSGTWVESFERGGKMGEVSPAPWYQVVP